MGRTRASRRQDQSAGDPVGERQILDPADPSESWRTRQHRAAINHVIWFVPWQTVPFFVFFADIGTARLVAARAGLWKSMPFSALALGSSPSAFLGF